MRRDVQEIFRNTPHEKQVMMFSATLSKEIRPVCKKFMQDVGRFKHLILDRFKNETAQEGGNISISVESVFVTNSLTGVQERSWRRKVEDEERRNGAWEGTGVR